MSATKKGKKKKKPQKPPMLRNVGLEEAFDDLYSRFIFTCPKEELSSSNRFYFIVERAHWFYIDVMREKTPQLPDLSLETFCKKLLLHKGFVKNCETLIADDTVRAWKAYKSKVPVGACLIFNPDYTKAIIVKSIKGSWTFPGGKVNKDESLCDCAVREVYEEIGVDFSSVIDPKLVIKSCHKGRDIMLFIIRNIPEDLDVKIESKQEILEIKWAPLEEIWQHKVLNKQKMKILLAIEKLQQGDKEAIEDIFEEVIEPVVQSFTDFKFSFDIYQPLLAF